MTGPPDRSAALQRVGGDVEALRELAEVFVRTCPEMLSRIRAALAAGSADQLAAAAHKLKGSAGFLEAGAVVEEARRLERAGREGDLAGAPAVLARLEAAVESALGVIAGWVV